MAVNYNDERFLDVENDKQQALEELNRTYDTLVNNSDQYYQAQIDASKQQAEILKQNQQAQTDFTIQQIEQQKEQTQKDYIKEQSGAYVDWQKQSGDYGVSAEQAAAAGMTNTGFTESSKVSMYNTYQNRVATARQSVNDAIVKYNNAITEAKLQNNSLLAEIAYQALQAQLELSLQGFQYKNQLLLEQSNKQLQLEQTYYQRYQDVLDQINHEESMAEQIRQFNASLAEEQRQFNASLAAKSGSGVVSGGVVSGGVVSGGNADAVKAAQQFVGTAVDGIWGKNSAAAAKAMGYNSLEEVVAAMGRVSSNGYTKESGTGYGTYTEARDAIKAMMANGATSAQLRSAAKAAKDSGELSSPDYNRLLTYIKNTSK